MSYYVQVDAQGKSWGTWKIEGSTAQRLGVPYPQNTPNAYVTAAPEHGETELDALKRQLLLLIGPTTHLVETKLAPGEYYPCMARPSDAHPTESPGYNPGNEQMKGEIAVAEGQLIALTRQLEGICQAVHPVGDNLRAFGHEIRNLLILACTEAEAHWRGVLEKHSVTPTNRRYFTTVDYVKLAEPMKLNEYAAAFPYYPWLHAMKPFEKWGVTGKPTHEIPWYSAYNAVKHSRGTEFHKATLLHAFQSVTACAILIYAQYGIEQRLPFFVQRLHFLEIIETPTWSPADVYLYPYADPYTGQPLEGWTPKRYPFGR
jgi:hypothetical protein